MGQRQASSTHPCGKDGGSTTAHTCQISLLIPKYLCCEEVSRFFHQDNVPRLSERCAAQTQALPTSISNPKYPHLQCGSNMRNTGRDHKPISENVMSVLLGEILCQRLTKSAVPCAGHVVYVNPITKAKETLYLHHHRTATKGQRCVVGHPAVVHASSAAAAGYWGSCLTGLSLLCSHGFT